MNGTWISRSLALLFALTVTAWLTPGISARQEDPATGAPAGPGIGDSVRLVAATNEATHVEIGTVTVSALEDPYNGPAFKEPNPGFRFVQADVTVTNTSTVPFQVSNWEFAAVDALGRYSTGQPPLYDDLDPEEDIRPSFGSFIDVPSGESYGGLVLFEVATDIDLAQILYYDTAAKEPAIIVALDLRHQQPGFGDPVPGVASLPDTAALFAAFPPVDPYGADGAATPAEDGFRHVGLTVLVENTGAVPFSVNYDDFALLDRDGFVIRAGSFERSPAAELAEPWFGAELVQGQRATGFLGFRVRADAEIVAVAYHPSYSHFLVLGEAAVEPSNPLPKPEPLDVVEGPNGPVVVTPGCEGVVEWSIDLFDRFERLEELDEAPLPEDPASADPAVVREVALMLRGLATEQAASAPPEIARAANEAFVVLLTLMADGLDGIAAAIESGDQALIDKAIAELDASLESFEAEYGPALTDLSKACPELDGLV